MIHSYSIKIQQSNGRLPLQIMLKTVGIKNADIKIANDITMIFWIICMLSFNVNAHLLL